MAKKSIEYSFWVVTSGKGMLPKGRKVGFITIESKSTDIEVVKEKAYQRIAKMVTDIYYFDLELKI